MIEPYRSELILDDTGVVAGMVNDDIEAAIFDFQNLFMTRDTGKHIGLIADSLYGSYNQQEMLQGLAFCVGAVTMLGAFKESSATKDVRIKTLHQFANRPQPFDPNRVDLSARHELVGKMAGLGSRIHPEVAPINSMLTRHFTNISLAQKNNDINPAEIKRTLIGDKLKAVPSMSDRAVGEAAYNGSGYAAWRLHRAWQEAETISIDEVVRTETANFDPTMLLN